MAKWTDMGHAMRRRMGAPSSHLEAAGPSTSRKHETSEEQYETAKTQNSPRASIGEAPMANSDNLDNSMSPVQDVDDYAGKAAKGTKGTMVPKKSTQSMDPTAGGKANRTNVAYTERLGASYRVSVPYTPTVDPTAGPTMANARTIPSVQGRQNPNFMGAINDQY